MSVLYRIAKRFEFSASHQLRALPIDHQCARLHGHNYVVEIELEARGLSPVGFVRDFGDLGAVKRFLDNEWDHRHLNEVLQDPTGIATTAENLARFLLETFSEQFPEITAVRVSETPKTWAEARTWGRT